MLAWRVRNLFCPLVGSVWLMGNFEVRVLTYGFLVENPNRVWLLRSCGWWEIRISVSYGYKVITLTWFSMNFCRKNWSHNNVHLNTSGWPMFQFLAILCSLWTSIDMKFLLTRNWDTKELMIVYCVYESIVYMLSTLPLKLCSGWYGHMANFLYLLTGTQ